VGECVNSDDELPRISIEKKDDFNYIKFVLRNEKNRVQKQKILAVRFDKEPMANILWNYRNEQMNVPSVRRIQQLLDESLGWNPHFLRHVRLSHLTINNNFSDQKLRVWAGWTDSRPASVYVKFRYQDFLE